MNNTIFGKLTLAATGAAIFAAVGTSSVSAAEIGIFQGVFGPGSANFRTGSVPGAPLSEGDYFQGRFSTLSDSTFSDLDFTLTFFSGQTGTPIRTWSSASGQFGQLIGPNPFIPVSTLVFYPSDPTIPITGGYPSLTLYNPPRPSAGIFGKGAFSVFPVAPENAPFNLRLPVIDLSIFSIKPSLSCSSN
jgi:hypothetical protein